MNPGLANSMVFTLLLVFALGCGDETTTNGGSTAVVAPSPPPLAQTEGHLSREQRGLSLDDYDLQVLGTEISAEQLNEHFGLLTLNVKYINWPALCAREGEGDSVQPKATVIARLEEIQQAGVNLAERGIHVNVDILTPGRSAIHHLCLADGVDARFDNLQLRNSMVAAFEDLGRGAWYYGDYRGAGAQSLLPSFC